MGSLLLIILIVVGYGLYTFLKHKRMVKDGMKPDRCDYTIGLPVVAVMGAFVGNLLMFASLVEEGRIKNGDASHCKRISISHPIVSINRQSETSGSFFLGTGSIGSTQYYYTYIKEDLGYKLHRFRTDDTHIIETNDAPNIKYDNFECPKTITTFMWTFGDSEYVKVYRQWNKQIHVPKNTILREFKL